MALITMLWCCTWSGSNVLLLYVWNPVFVVPNPHVHGLFMVKSPCFIIFLGWITRFLTWLNHVKNPQKKSWQNHPVTARRLAPRHIRGTRWSRSVGWRLDEWRSASAWWFPEPGEPLESLGVPLGTGQSAGAELNQLSSWSFFYRFWNHYLPQHR